MRRRLVLAGGLGLLAAAVLLVAVALSRFLGAGPATANTTVVIPRGAGVPAIARTLAAAGVIDSPLVFSLGVRLLGQGGALQAGEYVFPARISARGVVDMMAAGEVLRRRLTVAEGLTTAQIVRLLAAAEGLDGELPAEAAWPAEGALLPETYFYTRGDSRAALLGRMEKAMADALAELWPRRAADLPLKTPREAVTLASIVEKETAVAAERPRVAGVFLNRLRLGMPLQSDPTVIYAVTEGKADLARALTRADLATEHPYNTYLAAGLPPGPIANPGRASLEAVLEPLTTEDLYFVADGNGGHAFATTLGEHNRNVARWRALQADSAKRPNSGAPPPMKPAPIAYPPAAVR